MEEEEEEEEEEGGGGGGGGGRWRRRRESNHVCIPLFHTLAWFICRHIVQAIKPADFQPSNGVSHYCVSALCFVSCEN